MLCKNLQDLGIEGAVEFAYSISEHGLTPAAVRNYATLMNDRMDSLGQVSRPAWVAKHVRTGPGAPRLKSVLVLAPCSAHRAAAMLPTCQPAFTTRRSPPWRNPTF